MKKFDINNYFEWEKDCDGDSWTGEYEYYRIKLNIAQIAKDYGMDEQLVIGNIIDLNGRRFHLSQAVPVDGWYVNTDIDEQERWNEDFINNEIIPGLQRYIEKLINTSK